MIKRFIGLYLKYIIAKIKYRSLVKFNGFTVVYNFAKSSITFIQGDAKTIINSSPFSNMVGLYQRTIIVARYGGKITIGSGCGISGSTIYAMDEINIGNNVLIGGNCKILDNDFHPLPASQRINQKPENIKKRPINIGEGCFIGANSIILKDTTLGKNCVVGAGSVVSGTFPDNVIIAGNPARIIKENKQ
ncbi:MAG: acyltransferase [Lentimicrobiaceae bacterium]|nr:acyltransferase [Lentimicrobiaceae bacterium]